ncbi:hypothetical protein LTS18_008228, partial [Coniosporium uncinatum]
MFGWLYRCAPGLSLIIIVFFIIDAFSAPAPALVDCSFSNSFLTFPAPNVLLRRCVAGMTLSQIFLVSYTLICHLVLVMFGMRLSWSLYHVTTNIKRVRKARIMGIDTMHPKAQHLDLERYGREDTGTKAQEIVHAIIIPNYMEDVGTLKTTLAVLASHPRACQYEIYLAMEAREPGAREKATEVEGAMGNFFRGVHATFHPAGIAGEIAGKSSNVAFAARSIFQLYHSHPERDNVIMTVVD